MAANGPLASSSLNTVYPVFLGKNLPLTFLTTKAPNRDLKELTTTMTKWSTGSKNALLASTVHVKD